MVSGEFPRTPGPLTDATSGLRPDIFHGQHFLINPSVVDAIASEVPNNANCVEIGAGTGLLTAPLIERVKPNGQVVAYEIDDRCLPILDTLRSAGNLTVLHEDFLKARAEDLNMLDSLFLVGNVPYHILEPLLRKMVGIDFEAAILMLPNRFRDSVMAAHAGSREWSKNSIFSKAFFKVEPIIEAPRTDFDPPPPVDSTVVKFTRNDADLVASSDPVIKAYRAIAGTAITDETVASALRKITVKPDGKVEGGGRKDHQRHRQERRQRSQDLEYLRRQYNTTGQLSNDLVTSRTGYDLLEVAKRALGGKIDSINAPLVGVDTGAIRRVCAAIEGTINRQTKRKA